MTTRQMQGRQAMDLIEPYWNVKDRKVENALYKSCLI